MLLDATQKKFMFYKHGIFIDETCNNSQNDLNHALLVVG